MSGEVAEVTRIAALMQELGYRAQQIDDDTIRTAMSGFNVLVFVWPGESIQMYLGFTSDAHDRFGLEQANEFNREHRFVKCYVQPDAVRFEQDFYFNVSRPDAKDELERIFGSWETSIASALEALRAAERRDREDAAPPASPS